MHTKHHHFERGQWLGNGKRAYKVMRTYRSSDRVILRGAYVEFETSGEKLVRAGYRALVRKPRYANSERISSQ